MDTLWYSLEYHVKLIIQMNTIGSRIKEERERLGLNQEAFGKLGGVQKLAQLNYEKGKRQPSGEYLNQLHQHDEIDLEYIIHGVRRPPELDRSKADRNVLECLAVEIGIDLHDIYNVCEIALSEIKKRKPWGNN